MQTQKPEKHDGSADRRRDTMEETCGYFEKEKNATLLILLLIII